MSGHPFYAPDIRDERTIKSPAAALRCRRAALVAKGLAD